MDVGGKPLPLGSMAAPMQVRLEDFLGFVRPFPLGTIATGETLAEVCDGHHDGVAHVPGYSARSIGLLLIVFPRFVLGEVPAPLLDIDVRTRRDPRSLLLVDLYAERAQDSTPPPIIMDFAHKPNVLDGAHRAAAQVHVLGRDRVRSWLALYDDSAWRRLTPAARAKYRQALERCDLGGHDPATLVPALDAACLGPDRLPASS